jgi:hypothetical protein
MARQPPPLPFNRPRWTEREARAALAALERSRKPISVFAAEHGLDPQRLYSWRRRLGGAGPRAANSSIRQQLRGPRGCTAVDGFQVDDGRMTSKIEHVFPDTKVACSASLLSR